MIRSPPASTAACITTSTVWPVALAFGSTLGGGNTTKFSKIGSGVWSPQDRVGWKSSPMLARTAPFGPRTSMRAGPTRPRPSPGGSSRSSVSGTTKERAAQRVGPQSLTVLAVTGTSVTRLGSFSEPGGSNTMRTVLSPAIGSKPSAVGLHAKSRDKVTVWPGLAMGRSTRPRVEPSEVTAEGIRLQLARAGVAASRIAVAATIAATDPVAFRSRRVRRSDRRNVSSTIRSSPNTIFRGRSATSQAQRRVFSHPRERGETAKIPRASAASSVRPSAAFRSVRSLRGSC